MIKHIRIDNRLIHGQVAAAWKNNIGADAIIVCNDDVAKDPIQKMVLPMAAQGSKVLVFSINELIEYAKENRAEDTLYKEMKMLSRNLSAFPNLKEALSNPVLNIREKYSLICAAATGDQGVSRTFSRFITLVLKNNREQFLQFIYSLLH